MKTVTIENPTEELKELLSASHDDRVLVKRGGKPVALVIDVREKDEERIRLENDPEFWQMIQRSRKQRTVPWKQAKAELGLETRVRDKSGNGQKKTKKKAQR